MHKNAVSFRGKVLAHFRNTCNPCTEPLPRHPRLSVAESVSSNTDHVCKPLLARIVAVHANPETLHPMLHHIQVNKSIGINQPFSFHLLFSFLHSIQNVATGTNSSFHLMKSSHFLIILAKKSLVPRTVPQPFSASYCLYLFG